VLKPLVLFIAINVGASIGWYLGKPGGLMGSYFAAVFGASLGLFFGRKIQRSLSDD